MATFYFTYGSGGQPFKGGWTEVNAPDRATAAAAFRAFHPDKIPMCLDCCTMYAEDDFKRTDMYSDGNLGAKCHEIISVSRTLL